MNLLKMKNLKNNALTLVLILPGLSAHAGTVVAPPLPSEPVGVCDLQKSTPRQVVQLVVDNVVHATQKSLDDLLAHVSPDVVFKDPIMATQGREAFRKVYEQFITSDDITYKILDWSCSARTIYVSWIFGTKGKATQDQYVEWEGVTKLVVGKDDLITLELDNWNAMPPFLLSHLRQ
jgi:ketosteroid isomerase-like protein